MEQSAGVEGISVDEDYNALTREELVSKIRKLTIHVKQLRNVVKRDSQVELDSGRAFKKARRTRQFDFSRHPKRHVALKILYLGWDYQGLAVQEDTNNTVESYLFDALTKSKLIQERSTSNYHRCGRTDKGVSAFCQVISIDLRSKCTAGKGVITTHCDEWTRNQKPVSELEHEIDYCKILNAILPKEIRVLGWAPVRPDFSARFDCKERVYRYFIPGGDANIEAIREAGAYLLGEHDYQNFCKVDPSVEKSTTRRINSFRITRVCPENSADRFNIYEIEIVGQAFLWHQIRCIVAVLILVGKGLEKPDIVKDLLDLEKMPKKPQYSMAMDYPLVLFDTNHGDEIPEWIHTPDNIYHVMADLQAIWSQHSLKAEMMRAMMKSLEELPNSSKDRQHWIPPLPEPFLLPNHHLDSLVMGTKTKVYKSLAERPVCARSQNNNLTAQNNSSSNPS